VVTDAKNTGKPRELKFSDIGPNLVGALLWSKDFPGPNETKCIVLRVALRDPFKPSWEVDLWFTFPDRITRGVVWVPEMSWNTILWLEG